MTVDWRTLIYPLGFLSTLCFGLRFFIQWLQSEVQQKSFVPPIFWTLSLVGSALMAIHNFVQVQYPLCLIQATNVLLAWRNMDLLKPTSSGLSIKGVAGLLLLTCLVVTGGFIAQSLLCFEHFEWMRAPSGSSPEKLSLTWDLIGSAGALLFAARFWIQWWQVEHKRDPSSFSAAFWWLSICGALIASIYFVRMHDWVNIIAFGTGIIPYLRNLILLRRPAKPKRSFPTADIFMIAGEPSGDLHGAELIKALKQFHPNLRLCGIGGPLMTAAGMHCLIPLEKLSIMGFSAILKHLGRLIKLFYAIRNMVLAIQPACVIFIDYAEFNMRLARSLRRSHYKGKLVHYVCPTIWAWRAGRQKTLEETLDLLLTIFPFESKLFANSPLNVKYIGHPLQATIQHHLYSPHWKKKCGIAAKRPLLSLFPGSRKSDVSLNLPLQLQAALLLKEQHPDLCLAISVGHESFRPLIETQLQKQGLAVGEDVRLVPAEYRYDLMKHSRIALAKSGTVSLELALHGVPTAATYPLGFFNWLIGKYIFRIRMPYYVIVNILQDKEVFPEFIDRKPDHRTISAKLAQFYSDSIQRETCLKECAQIIEQLGPTDAHQEAAQAIIALLDPHASQKT